MKKLIPCMLAGLIITGLFALCITSFLAPSSDYILNSLESTEEPFYITLQPESQFLVLGTPTFLTARSNLTDVIYQWEFSIDNMSSWDNVTGGVSFDGAYFIINSRTRNYFYRCKIIHGDDFIYSVPAMVSVVSSSNSNSLLLKSELEELEKNSEFDEFDKTEVFEESEVTE